MFSEAPAICQTLSIKIPDERGSDASDLKAETDGKSFVDAMTASAAAAKKACARRRPSPAVRPSRHNSRRL